MAAIMNSKAKERTAASHRVLALYKFVAPKFTVDSLMGLQFDLHSECTMYGAKGTLLLAQEGINGTICYPYPVDQSEDPLLEFLQSKFDYGLRIRVSESSFNVFPRMKVKIKSEIVTLHRKDCDPIESKGVYVKPEQWNELLNDPECLVVDTRNEYEIRVGTFRNAINPHTQNFVEFPDWMKQNVVGRDTPKKIAMFCTGGIRCEKATNACQKLVPSDVQVFHLEGGILNYLDSVPPEESLFDGECYVFDQRVAVTYGNQPSRKFTDSCKACRHPLSKEDMEGEEYVEGLACRWCVERQTEKQKDRFASRQRQVQLAKDRGIEDFFDPQQMRKHRS